MADPTTILIATGTGRAVRVQLLEKSGVQGIDVRAMTAVAPTTPEALAPTAGGAWLPLPAAAELARAIATVAGYPSIMAEAAAEGRGASE